MAMNPMGDDFRLMTPIAPDKKSPLYDAPVRPDMPRNAPSMTRMQQLRSDLNAAKNAKQAAMTQAKALPDRAARTQAIADARSGMKDARSQAYETFRSTPKTTITPTIGKPIAPDKTAPLMPPPSAPVASTPPGMKKGGKTTVMKTASKGRKCDW